MNSPNEVKARANKLRDVLDVMGHHLKHSESLEVISKIDGYRDWNTYIAEIAKGQKTTDRTLRDIHASTGTNSPDHPVVEAIKMDNEVLLRESLSSEVLSNKTIMAEAFYQSVVLERIALAEALIEQGADVGSVVIRQRSLFEFAIHTEREEYLKMLVFKFKHLKDIHPKSSNVLPLVISLLGKEDDALEPTKILLDQGANIDAQIRGGETAVIFAGWVRDDFDLVKLLVERGADVNKANENGDTPLIDAAYKGNIELVEYLLNNGADISIKNNAGHTALDVASRRGNSEAVQRIAKRQT